MITFKTRFIKGDPPPSARGRSQTRERVNWGKIVDKARTKPGRWLKVEVEDGYEAGASVFRHYEDIEIAQRGSDLYIKATEN